MWLVQVHVKSTMAEVEKKVDSHQSRKWSPSLSLLRHCWTKSFSPWDAVHFVDLLLFLHSNEIASYMARLSHAWALEPVSLYVVCVCCCVWKKYFSHNVQSIHDDGYHPESICFVAFVVVESPESTRACLKNHFVAQSRATKGGKGKPYCPCFFVENTSFF